MSSSPLFSSSFFLCSLLCQGRPSPPPLLLHSAMACSSGSTCFPGDGLLHLVTAAHQRIAAPRGLLVLLRRGLLDLLRGGSPGTAPNPASAPSAARRPRTPPRLHADRWASSTARPALVSAPSAAHRPAPSPISRHCATTQPHLAWLASPLARVHTVPLHLGPPGSARFSGIGSTCI